MKKKFEIIIKCPVYDCGYEFIEFEHKDGHSYCPKCGSNFSNYRTEDFWEDEIEYYITGYKLIEIE